MTANTEASQPERKFPFAMPRRWKNKENGKEVKVLPWFQPVEERSQFDFKGLMKELMPEIFEGDHMADFECYKGLVMFCGWQIENENNIWFCLPANVKDQFDDLGEWAIVSEQDLSRR